MDVNIKQLAIPGVLLIEPMCFEDNRGYFLKPFIRKNIKQPVLNRHLFRIITPIQPETFSGASLSVKASPGKLIYAVTGTIFDVAVDIRKNAPTFGQWTGAELSAENKRQIYVPHGFAHGFVVLSESADVIYKCTDLYAPGDEYGLLWSDPEIGISWPIENPILSQKDLENPGLKEISESNLPV